MVLIYLRIINFFFDIIDLFIQLIKIQSKYKSFLLSLLLLLVVVVVVEVVVVVVVVVMSLFNFQIDFRFLRIFDGFLS